MTEAIEHNTSTCSPIFYKDIVVIAWIDPDQVPLPTTGIDHFMTQFYPPSGIFSSSHQRVLTMAHLGWLMTDPIHPFWPRKLDRQERKYITHWMFKYGSNHSPPTSFTNTSALVRFAHRFTKYKLYNHLRTGMYVGIHGPASAIHNEAHIGVTIEPIWHGRVPGEAASTNGNVWFSGDCVCQDNRGDPDWKAVRAFNILADDLGKRWTSIGSIIKQSIASIDALTVETENYPTYWIYVRIACPGEDGPYLLTEKRNQASSPEDHMV